ncbi:hypothetical protein J6E39_07820 [bacterium]|nr:hypothetical protein [bacterium]
MTYLEEQNKNLINLRTSLITVIIVITSGLAGIVLTKSFSLVNILILVVPGVYFDFIFMQNILSINSKLNENIRRLQDE